MFKRTEKPYIKFRHREDHEFLDKPTIASKMMPKWLKNLPRVAEGSHKNGTGTVKRCVPVLDAVRQGYIIPSWCDWHINVTENDVTIVDGETGEAETTEKQRDIFISAAGNIGFSEMISTHSWEQVGDDCPLKHYPVGKYLFKFTNPWVIETPKGWSCMFKSPSNQYNNIRLVEGVVDTDTYLRQINFPFFWDGCDVGEYEVKKGDPLIHVVPFKRETIELKFDTWDHEYMTKMDRVHETLFFDRYRKLWWNKRKAD